MIGILHMEHWMSTQTWLVASCWPSESSWRCSKGTQYRLLVRVVGYTCSNQVHTATHRHKKTFSHVICLIYAGFFLVSTQSHNLWREVMHKFIIINNWAQTHLQLEGTHSLPRAKKEGSKPPLWQSGYWFININNSNHKNDLHTWWGTMSWYRLLGRVRTLQTWPPPTPLATCMHWKYRRQANPEQEPHLTQGLWS